MPSLRTPHPKNGNSFSPFFLEAGGEVLEQWNVDCFLMPLFVG